MNVQQMKISGTTRGASKKIFSKFKNNNQKFNPRPELRRSNRHKMALVEAFGLALGR